MHKLGQHFLTSAAIAKRMVESANIQPTDVVLEVGPGKGMLTQFLVEKAKKVIAIEKDRQFVPYLREKYKDAKNLEIVEGDILKIPLNPHFLRQRTDPPSAEKGELLSRCNRDLVGFPTLSFKIVANLPYYITSRFLRLFLEEMVNKPQSMMLMVQKEVAERICAKPPNMNLLALSVQAFGTPHILFKVSRGSFLPPPEVDSAVIAIEHISDAFFKKHHISPKEFFKLPKKAFSQKRKMLRASLSNHIAEVGLPHIEHLLKKRPQELSLEDWAIMFKA